MAAHTALGGALMVGVMGFAEPWKQARPELSHFEGETRASSGPRTSWVRVQM